MLHSNHIPVMLHTNHIYVMLLKHHAAVTPVIVYHNNCYSISLHLYQQHPSEEIMHPRPRKSETRLGEL
jgi:thymidylate synthase